MNKKTLSIILSFVFLIGAGVLVSMYLIHIGFDPSGNDIWSHLYKGDFMYHRMKEGHFYALYSPDWYNGIQIYRYWAPLSYYVLAFLEFLTGGDIILAYQWFAAFCIIVGGIPWILWGIQRKAPFLGLMIAFIWFFLPENIRVYLCEGNTPRIMTMVVIPYVIYFIWRYLRKDDTKALWGIGITMCLMVYSHLMITAMLGVGTFLFLLFDGIGQKNFKKGLWVLFTMIAGLLMAGIWMMPALSGGIMSMEGNNSEAVMSFWMTDLLTLINPMNRINGVTDSFYYGVLVLLLAVLGLLLARKGKKAGFVVFILLLVTTASTFLPILSKLPLNTLFWMARFSAIAYGFFLFSFMDWESLKKKYLYIALAILVVECIPSLNLSRYQVQTSQEVKEEMEMIKENTKDRVNLMDLSSFGSYPSWGLCRGGNTIKSTFGWAWQGASTASNIVRLNTALEQKNFLYLFDRSLEMGDDTVYIRKNTLEENGVVPTGAIQDLIEAANALKFQLIQRTETGFLFQYQDSAKAPFGVKTRYLGLAVGAYADITTMFYPGYKLGDSTYVDDYELEDFKQYQTLFFSGIHYHDRKKAEQLLRDASDAGCKVVIDVTHVQEDGATKRMSFLDVTTQSITIDDHFPELTYKGETLKTSDFPEEYEDWFTGYVNQSDEALGTMQYNNRTITWLGRNQDNPNIYYLGLNLMFFGIETADPDVLNMLDDLLGIGREDLPERKVVPLELTWDENHLHIHSEEENVTTGLAFQDNFVTSQNVEEEDHLFKVCEKDTDFEMVYPKKGLGIATTILGIFLLILLYLFTRIGTGRRFFGMVDDGTP